MMQPHRHSEMRDRTQLVVSGLDNGLSKLWTRFGARERMIASTVAVVLALAGTLVQGAGIDSEDLVNRRFSRYRPTTNQPPAESEYRNYRYAAVTTDTNICSKIGTEILAVRSGSAVDAAIASMLCVGVVNAHSTGLGGGHFATIYERPRKGGKKVLVTLISGETAPLLAEPNMFIHKPTSYRAGVMGIGTPGQLSGFYAAWKRFGRVPWAVLIQPMIELCEKGFEVESALSLGISMNEQAIRNQTYLSEVFVKADGSLVTKGDILVDRKLANTFRRIAVDPQSFYSGSLAEDIVADIQEMGGIISLEDLQKYSSEWKEPQKMVLSNGGFTFYNPPPPSCGAVLNFVANVLNGYNFKPSDLAENKTLVYHRFVEAFKFGYAKRTELGDSDFLDVSSVLKRMASSGYAEEIRKKIDDSTTHDVNYYEPKFDIVQDNGTTHLNVLAPDGSAVSMTSSIHLYFGSKIRGRRTGIIFNNALTLFSSPGTASYLGVPPSPGSYIEPGKRPLTSMAPTIVFDRKGEVVLLTGASGGPRIITSTGFVALYSLWFDFDLKTATDSPRIYHQLMPNFIGYEPGFNSAVLEGLRAKGHSTVEVDPKTVKSIVGSIRNRCHSIGEGECIEAVSDGRKGGTPDGY